MITQKELKKRLKYDPETGIFTWLIITSNRVKVGDVAGFNSCGYLRISLDNESYQAHRLACLYMIGKFPENQTDHINHIRNDNRWVNLRDVTHGENLKNSTMSKNNTSGITGVCWGKDIGKWISRIMVNRKDISLGRFACKFEAACVRKSAENKYGFHKNHGQANAR